MSIDPFTRRNPSYCFVEVTSKAQAEQATRDLNGTMLLGRPLKVGPGVAARSKKRTLTAQNYDLGRNMAQGPSSKEMHLTDGQELMLLPT